MRRVLVTGANGFIGRHALAPLVARGFEVVASGLGSAPPEAADCSAWLDVDLLQPGSAGRLVREAQPSHLLHLAWPVSSADYWTSLSNLDWARASAELAREFVRAGGARMAAAGTCAEYDWNSERLSEADTPLVPRTVYGAGKHLLNLLLDEICGSRTSAAWGRVFFVFGPFESPGRLVASVARSLLSGETAKCSPGEQIRDFSYVKDVAGAFAALLDSDVRGPVNIASGSAARVRDVVEAVAREVGRPDLVQLGAVPMSPGEPPVIEADVRRLREEVAWSPQYDLRRGVAETVAWWRERLSGGAR